MLNLVTQSRRSFLHAGSLTAAGLTLPELLRARASQTATGRPTKSRSVIWLWLGGGAPQIETFDPKMSAPVEFRSTTGAVQTKIAGISIGGTFEKVGQQADKIAFVRSFAHNSSGHAGGTVWMNTGYQSPVQNEINPLHPSYGAILSRVRGPSHPRTGMPTFIRMNRVPGPSWLGATNAAFDAEGGKPGRNMIPIVSDRAMQDRRAMRQSFDSVQRDIDQSGLLEGLDSFERQAFDLIQGAARDAFDVLREDRATLALYNVSGPQLVNPAVNQVGFDPDGVRDIARHLLLARRLCEAGAGFVTVAGGSWDLHGQNPRSRIQDGLQRMGPVLDHAIAAFLQDLHNRGLQDEILLVVSGDFGRTPRINDKGGRDHWGTLCPLALAGGGLKMGQVVGASNPRAEAPQTTPHRPVDLMATLFHVLGIPQDLHITDATGRPIPMLRGGRPIGELV